MNAAGARAERRVRRHYRLRGYTILAANARAGGAELDIVVRRGRRLVFCEVKMRRDGSFGDPLEAVGPLKRNRIRRAAETFVASHPDLHELEVAFEVVAVRGRSIERRPLEA